MVRDDFMLIGYMPSCLPVSCLTMAPRFDTKPNQSLIAGRGPLMEINKDIKAVGTYSDSKGGVRKQLNSYNGGDSGVPKDSFLSDLHKQLGNVMKSNPTGKFPLLEDEAEDPKCSPIFWVSKWVDYSDKYGFGYALCDESIGVVFNDLTKLLLLSDGT